jgi:hypothetical protein
MKQTTTIHYIESKGGPESNPFEHYRIVRTDRSASTPEYIAQNAADYVWETFSLFKKDRDLNGWVCVDDEYGEAALTENTVLIPVRQMTDREVRDFVIEEATRRTQDDLDDHGSRFFDWEHVYDCHETSIERGE